LLLLAKRFKAYRVPRCGSGNLLGASAPKGSRRIQLDGEGNLARFRPARLTVVETRRCQDFFHRVVSTYGWHVVLGVTFFGIVCGFTKLDPRNIAWISFKDNRQHWIGWQFFATDRWRWPLGANPNYGWNGINSVVFTDSWPILALPLKVLRLEVLQDGQFFGLAWLGSSILLFVGCAKVFAILRVPQLHSSLGSVLVASTPLFWWMHRWYFAISGGVALIVWAIYLYLRDSRRARYSLSAWLVVLVIAVGTNMYLCAMLIPIAAASIVRHSLTRPNWCCHILGNAIFTGALLLGSMYIFGYFTMPLASASTGRYGVYSANMLGIIDMNQSSRFFPDVPSMPLQYEPTSIGLGVLLLLITLTVLTPPIRYLPSLGRSLRRHWLFVLVVIGMFCFSVSHVVTIGSRTEFVPLPARIVELLSVFQSSTRFIFPLTVTVAILAVVFVSRFSRLAIPVLSVALVVQMVDISHEVRSVAQRPDGRESTTAYDAGFWEEVPRQYTRLSFHYAENIRTGWDECSLAAVRTLRIANCAYLSRAPDFAPINAAQDDRLLSGNPNPHVVYWLTFGWFLNHEQQIRELYGDGQHGLATFGHDSVSKREFIMLFPYCHQFDRCNFLGSRKVSVDQALEIIG